MGIDSGTNSDVTDFNSSVDSPLPGRDSVKVPNSLGNVFSALTATEVKDFDTFANPFTPDNKQSLVEVMPNFPLVSCTYEIHTTFLGKSFDLAPCQKLQILRDILYWAFAFLTSATCYRIAFRSNK
jgi:hypothetical protein